MKLRVTAIEEKELSVVSSVRPLRVQVANVVGGLRMSGCTVTVESELKFYVEGTDDLEAILDRCEGDHLLDGWLLVEEV